MTSNATTVAEYLEDLPEDRREAISTIRDVILKNLPEGFEETIQYGMISYVVPHSIYPAGYHTNPKDALPYASLASQKNHMALYVSAPYSDPEIAQWFKESFAKSGKKLDMGKSCVRFKKLDDLPLDVIGELFAQVPLERYVDLYESNLAESKVGKK